MSEKIETLVDVNPPKPGDEPDESPQLSGAEQDAVRELVRQARASGAALTGPDGLLKQLTKMVVEAALDEEMNEHLGYEPGDPEGAQPRQLPQRETGQDGDHRQRRLRRDRGPP